MYRLFCYLAEVCVTEDKQTCHKDIEEGKNGKVTVEGNKELLEANRMELPLSLTAHN